MLLTVKNLLDLDVYPLEVANLRHWHIDWTSHIPYYIAPQFILLDDFQAYALCPLGLTGFKRKGRPSLEALLYE